MVETHATSTIDRNWNYLNQALQHGVRYRTIKTNPAADCSSRTRCAPTKEALDAAGTGAVDATHETFAQLDRLLVTLR
ncbi:hypothetical protein [Rhabdothermincola sediminis]|uniref:hypothetical protein n=1 Tax=Rhabdothermincola sediminis TaxID=2751370 RepID=UPI001AA06565|nr:hypothetical protein [Rhabdothermincola sediminis]